MAIRRIKSTPSIKSTKDSTVKSVGKKRSAVKQKKLLISRYYVKPTKKLSLRKKFIRLFSRTLRPYLYFRRRVKNRRRWLYFRSVHRFLALNTPTHRAKYRQLRLKVALIRIRNRKLRSRRSALVRTAARQSKSSIALQVNSLKLSALDRQVALTANSRKSNRTALSLEQKYRWRLLRTCKKVLPRQTGVSVKGGRTPSKYCYVLHRPQLTKERVKRLLRREVKIKLSRFSLVTQLDPRPHTVRNALLRSKRPQKGWLQKYSKKLSIQFRQKRRLRGRTAQRMYRQLLRGKRKGRDKVSLARRARAMSYWPLRRYRQYRAIQRAQRQGSRTAENRQHRAAIRSIRVARLQRRYPYRLREGNRRLVRKELSWIALNIRLHKKYLPVSAKFSHMKSGEKALLKRLFVATTLSPRTIASRSFREQLRLSNQLIRAYIRRRRFKTSAAHTSGMLKLGGQERRWVVARRAHARVIKKRRVRVQHVSLARREGKSASRRMKRAVRPGLPPQTTTLRTALQRRIRFRGSRRLRRRRIRARARARAELERQLRRRRKTRKIVLTVQKTVLPYTERPLTAHHLQWKRKVRARAPLYRKLARTRNRNRALLQLSHSSQSADRVAIAGESLLRALLLFVSGAVPATSRTAVKRFSSAVALLLQQPPLVEGAIRPLLQVAFRLCPAASVEEKRALLASAKTFILSRQQLLNSSVSSGTAQPLRNFRVKVSAVNSALFVRASIKTAVIRARLTRLNKARGKLQTNLRWKTPISRRPTVARRSQGAVLDCIDEVHRTNLAPVRLLIGRRRSPKLRKKAIRPSKPLKRATRRSKLLRETASKSKLLKATRRSKLLTSTPLRLQALLKKTLPRAKAVKVITRRLSVRPAVVKTPVNKAHQEAMKLLLRQERAKHKRALSRRVLPQLSSSVVNRVARRLVKRTLWPLIKARFRYGRKRYLFFKAKNREMRLHKKLKQLRRKKRSQGKIKRLVALLHRRKGGRALRALHIYRQIRTPMVDRTIKLPSGRKVIIRSGALRVVAHAFAGLVVLSERTRTTRLKIRRLRGYRRALSIRVRNRIVRPRLLKRGYYRQLLPLTREQQKRGVRHRYRRSTGRIAIRGKKVKRFRRHHKSRLKLLRRGRKKMIRLSRKGQRFDQLVQTLARSPITSASAHRILSVRTAARTLFKKVAWRRRRLLRVKRFRYSLQRTVLRRVGHRWDMLRLRLIPLWREKRGWKFTKLWPTRTQGKSRYILTNVYQGLVDSWKPTQQAISASQATEIAPSIGLQKGKRFRSTLKPLPRKIEQRRPTAKSTAQAKIHQPAPKPPVQTKSQQLTLKVVQKVELPSAPRKGQRRRGVPAVSATITKVPTPAPITKVPTPAPIAKVESAPVKEVAPAVTKSVTAARIMTDKDGFRTINPVGLSVTLRPKAEDFNAKEKRHPEKAHVALLSAVKKARSELRDKRVSKLTDAQRLLDVQIAEELYATFRLPLKPEEEPHTYEQYKALKTTAAQPTEATKTEIKKV